MVGLHAGLGVESEAVVRCCWSGRLFDGRVVGKACRKKEALGCAFRGRIAKQVLFQLSYIPVDNGLWPAAISSDHLRGSLASGPGADRCMVCLAPMAASSLELPASFDRHLRAENRSVRTSGRLPDRAAGPLEARQRHQPRPRPDPAGHRRLAASHASAA